MRREGVELQCNRCGRVEFHPYHPLKTKYPDDKPREWLFLDENVHLCPHCAERYLELLSAFLNTKEVRPYEEG